MSGSDRESEAAPVRRTLPSLERGKDLSRIFAFTDGVFAIAITLLVLQIEVPQGLTSGSGFLNQINDEAPDFFAFALSFVVIGLYWIGNHRAMRMVREYDRGLMLLTLLHLGFIVLLPYSSQLLGEYGSRIPLTVAFYIVNIVLITVSMALMFRHMRAADLAEPDYEWAVELEEKSLWFTAGFFVLTIPFIWVIGAWTPALWLLLRFDPYQRKRDRIQAGN
ncbi:MAG: TMEM175 family protein [Actinomycetota bacterium]|nr:TMEM175 family protein [Actinomycetota bacterium]